MQQLISDGKDAAAHTGYAAADVGGLELSTETQ